MTGLSALAPAGELNFTGFGTVGLGTALSGVKQRYFGFDCPCYIANYPDVGVYGKKLDLGPDSRFGLQATYRLDGGASFTGQVTAHGGNDLKPAMDWAYGSLPLGDAFTLQVGRKRLPLFGYSDFFQVGYAYPWVRPPGDLYGWQIVAYNGANLLYRRNYGGLSVSANVWAGSENDKGNRMLDKIYYDAPVDEKWKGIVGGYLELGTDWGAARFVMMTNKVDRLVSGTVNKSGVKQNFYGLTFNVDHNDWVLRTEFNRFVRPDAPKDIYNVYFVGAGRRFGDWLPMLTYSRFTEDYKDDPTANEKHNTLAATLRWDFRDNMALKLEYDVFKDKSGFPFVGNSKAIAVSVDFTF
ncbi:hypothetical protein [Pelomonas sp. SE-A7]|uniref:hypothetical protein n=1 Tax=Pelomonas sp. SE-A7 TaxID=3054953 RepID=UPI00259CBD31|nr:hypothetical protein [Pelomonas sp. SE-A7]MDM4768414.1 hypothetical protein [Pelomonas sp. SE-A7]